MLNSKEFSNNYYSSILSDNEKIYNKNKLVTVSKCLKLLPDSGRVLDIGCFNGYVLDILKNKGYETYGIDASKNAVKLCSEKGHIVLEADLEKEIPFEENFFDCVLGMEIIEHIADTDTLLKEVKRVLKPNGVLVMSTPNFFSLGRRLMTLFGVNPYFEASFSFPPRMAGHLRFYTHDLLHSFLKFSGFRNIELYSDAINFVGDGRFFSEILADLFPKFGRGVIVSCKK